MEATPQPTPDFVKAQENVTEAERVLNVTTPLLIDRLLIATGGNVALVTELMSDIANLAGQAGALAVAKRRENSAKYQTEHQELQPDNMSPRQDSVLFGDEGAQPIISALEKIQERADLVAKGESPVQKPSPKPPTVG
jgi:hypothetical protein